MKKLITIAALITLLMMMVSSVLVVSAQDETPTTVEAGASETVPPTETPTETPVPPTDTPVPPTDTPVPTEVPTDTPVPPTDTPVPTEVPTDTPVPPTDTPVPPTGTPVPTATPVPTVEPTATPVPTVGAGGDITVQQTYGGTWTSYIAVQNMGTGSTDIVVDWYLNGAASACGNSSYAGLQPGRSVRFTPAGDACGSSWVGSAVVSGAEPLAAVAENMGSQGQLLAEYVGGSEPSTETIIIPQTGTAEWDPLIGISNAGNNTANVVVTFLNRDGTVYTHSNNPYVGMIPAQSAIQIRPRDIIGNGWRGTVKIEQNGTSEPLYAVNKAERFIASQKYPVTVAYEGWKVSDAASEFVIPGADKRMTNNVPNGQNMTIDVMNPDATYPVTVTISWFNLDGSEVVAARNVLSLPAQGTLYQTTRDNTGLPAPWTGMVRVSAVYAGGPNVGNPSPVIVLAEPWVAVGGKYYYKAWGVYRPVNPSTGGTLKAYVPSVHKESQGGSRTGNGWCTSISVANLDTNVNNPPTRVRIRIYKENSASLSFQEERDVAPNGRYFWYTLKQSFDATLGTSAFFGGAVVEVVDGPGTIAVSVQQTGNAYGVGSNATSDAYGFYTAISE